MKKFLKSAGVGVKKVFKKSKVVVCSAIAVMSTVAVGLVASATDPETTTSSTISSAMSSGLDGIKDDALGIIGTVLPYGLAIIGASLVITIGIKVFKKLTGR